MRVNSIEKVFYEKGKTLTFAEAKEKALLFFEYIQLTDEDLSDYWFGLSDNWDMNIWHDELMDNFSIDLYCVSEDGCTYYDSFGTICP